MAEERQSIEISLLGSSFTIRSHYDPRYMSEVIAYLREKIREIQSGSSIRDPLKIALLAALNVTDELLQAKQAERPAALQPPGGGGDSGEIERIAERIIETIDRGLTEN